MPTGRVRAALRALSLARRIDATRRLEGAALARAGEAVARTWATVDPAPAAVARVVEARRRIAALDAATSASLDQDRADYASVAVRVQPLVITRGLAARVILRHQRRVALRHLDATHADLGRATLDGTAGLPAAAVPHILDEAIASARADLAAAERERAELLAPLGGSLLPHGLATVVTEGSAFGRAVWTQLRGQLLPRAPALAGLVVGWWVAHTYTDSRWKAALHRFGFGDGGTTVVSPETYERMRFWLPLLAAAACAYAGSRLAALIRRRYGSAADGGSALSASHSGEGAPLRTPPVA